MKLEKTEDGLQTYFSDTYQETYHSIWGVLQEAQHVFLEGTDVEQKIKHSGSLNILEIGFGTGFNFLLTSSKALENNTPLNYYSVENDLLNYDEIAALNHNILFADNPVYDAFLTWRKQAVELKPGLYRIEQKDIHLVLLLQNAIRAQLPVSFFDAVYHDAFSPAKNPELWTIKFFEKLYQSMKKGAKLATYSSKGDVRRSLKTAGFEVGKKAGPKGKREMLVATKIS